MKTFVTVIIVINQRCVIHLHVIKKSKILLIVIRVMNAYANNIGNTISIYISKKFDKYIPIETAKINLERNLLE